MLEQKWKWKQNISHFHIYVTLKLWVYIYITYRLLAKVILKYLGWKFHIKRLQEDMRVTGRTSTLILMLNNLKYSTLNSIQKFFSLHEKFCSSFSFYSFLSHYWKSIRISEGKVYVFPTFHIKVDQRHFSVKCSILCFIIKLNWYSNICQEASILALLY